MPTPMIRFLLFLSLWSICLLPEGMRAQGLKLDDEAYSDVLLQPSYGQKSDAEDNALRVDLRPYCPPVQNQGRTATCTGWAVGYAALSIEHAVREEWENNYNKVREEAFSALFVYNQIREIRNRDCGSPSSIEAALQLLQEKGNVKHRDFDPGGCDRYPSSIDFDKAEEHRIKEFRRLFKLDANEKNKIKSIRKSLARQHPVIVGMFIKKNFYNQFGQEMYFADRSPIAEAHAMTVVGYDDGRGREGAFLLMNSWGVNWGDQGFIWIEYETFAELCTRAYELSLEEPKEIAQQIQRRPTEGRVEVERIVMEDSLVFRPATPLYQNLYYRFPRTEWKVGGLFQIKVSDVTDEKYLYAFTYDARGRIKIHFPRKKESSIISSPSALLTLPEIGVAFKLEHPGDEYICLLFSSDPIPDFERRIKNLQASQKTFPLAFSIYFGDLLFTSSTILYEKEEMHYYSRYGVVDKCIPILMKLKVDPS